MYDIWNEHNIYEVLTEFSCLIYGYTFRQSDIFARSLLVISTNYITCNIS